MAKILVTGGTGFIGAPLVRALAEQHEHVRVLARLESPVSHALTALRPTVELIQGDVTIREDVERAMADIEVVYHLAGIGAPASKETLNTAILSTNCVGTELVLQAAAHEGVKRVVLASSASVYGDESIPPIRESAYPHPRSAYAVSKLSAEMMCEVRRAHGDLDAVALRVFNVYGPGQPEGFVIPKFHKMLEAGLPITLFGSGKQTRDFIFISDVIDALIAIGFAPDLTYPTYNIGSGTGTSIRDLVEHVAASLGVTPVINYRTPRVTEVNDSVADIERVASDVGFRPKISLSEGLRLTWNTSRDQSRLLAV